MDPILVTGATGRVGRHLVSQLLAKGAKVRALSRNPDKAGLPHDVEVVRGDLTMPETLNVALEGIGKVFLVWTSPAGTFANALEQIVRHAEHLVLLSSPHKTPHPFFQQPNPLAAMYAEIEHLIETSGLQWTFLRPGMFAANALAWWAPQILVGEVVRWPYANAFTAPVHEQDIAAVAAHTLLESKHDGAEYVLTGPASLSQSQQVAIIGDVIGRQLRLEEISPDEARRELGFPPPVMNMLLNAWAAAVGHAAFVTNTVKEVTEHQAQSFHNWVSDHAAAFRS